MRKLFDKLYKKSAQSFYEILSDNLKNNKKTFVVTANPETFMISEKNEDVRKMLLDKETVICFTDFLDGYLRNGELRIPVPALAKEE